MTDTSEKLAPAATSPTLGTETEGTTVIAEVSDSETTGVTVTSLIVSVVSALLVTFSALAAYHTWFAFKPTTFGKIQLAEIVEIRQLQFSMSVVAAELEQKASAREEAVAKIAQVSKEIEAAVDGLAADCGCTLLVTGAVISSDIPDYTQALKERMGMGGVNLEALRKQAAMALSPSNAFSPQSN